MAQPARRATFLHDTLLIGAIGTVAACGLVYEYLMAHYAGRILGAVEPTIYAMIGLMIMSMGLGAFAAKWVSSIFRAFAWLELAIGLLGGVSVLFLSGVVAFSYALPDWLRTIYGIDATVTMSGGFVTTLQYLAVGMPFVLGFVIGFLVGMEIPLIARVRERIHQSHLEHNLGTMYGADYIGAGIGAMLWIFICLKLPVVYAAVGTATLNAIVGIVFLGVYRKRLQPAAMLWAGHGALLVMLGVLAVFGTQWITRLSDTLFVDRVAYQMQTPYQSIVLTKRHVSRSNADVLSLYLNGRLQFASNDERIYHAYLTTPAMLASYRRQKVLVLGGGDGLALRDLLAWEPESVTLVDLDGQLLDLFSGRDANAPGWLTEQLLTLNEGALLDPRVNVVRGDAFIQAERLAAEGAVFDVIIVDLPDPNHPDLNKLYSDFFYATVANVLSPDGAIAIQSTSPYHAKEAFLSIGKTLRHAGYEVQQYHANVPSFGEWGWTIGTRRGKPALQRIAELGDVVPPDGLLAAPQLAAAFVFPLGFFDLLDQVEINRLGTHVVYEYHQDAWQAGEGLMIVEKPVTVSPSSRHIDQAGRKVSVDG